MRPRDTTWPFEPVGRGVDKNISNRAACKIECFEGTVYVINEWVKRKRENVSKRDTYWFTVFFSLCVNCNLQVK